MMKKETVKKIESCKALQGKQIVDIVASDKFISNLAAYWTAQKEDRKATRQSYEAMRKLGGAKGYKVPAHCIDDLKDLTTEQLAQEFLTILVKRSTRPAAERQYISQIGMQAYNLTIAQIVVEEYPELESELIPKSKTS